MSIEKKLIGLCIMFEATYRKISEHGNIFLLPDNRKIYQVLSDLYNKYDKIDTVMILPHIQELDITATYYNECIDLAITRSDDDTLIKKQIEHYNASQVQKIKYIIDECNNATETIKNIHDHIDEKIKNHENQTTVDADQYILNRDNGLYVSKPIYTGYNQLDGFEFERGELVVVSARPSIGKTTLALNILLRSALKKNSVLFFSAEMPHQHIYQKMLMNMACITKKEYSNPKILNDDRRIDLDESQKMIKQLQIQIDDSSGIEIETLYKRAIKLHDRKQVDVIAIDYIQLLRTQDKKLSTLDRIEKITQTLKRLARNTNTVIFALAQLNRNIEGRSEDSEPKMSDLKGSGSIEQDADKILTLHATQRSTYTDSLQLTVLKNRNGATGKISLSHDKVVCRMLEV